ncbi:MFS transporter [Trichocoleus sp. FACHB-262]|uniref:MFS transporter n=1 Tax=Trichocoleus sp. FACHB-262 TaxID=2692869 RepID=UPI0018EFA751|nr:MFS transporter [Trichocoleus sp. FACHB-262]
MTNYLTEETIFSLGEVISESIAAVETSLSQPLATEVAAKVPKAAIRSSLRASTWDGVFATLFSNITGGVLLSNFLVELDASTVQIGMLASIPMVANLLQPLGAYWADRTSSRRWYGLCVYGISRLLWLPLAIAILVFNANSTSNQTMIIATLAALLATHVLGALGSASWLAWLALLVPRQLRGRYFGFRNSAFSLTSLVAMPLLGLAVSHFPGGSIQGFGVFMLVGIVAGLLSLACQSRMTDVNPQARLTAPEPKSKPTADATAAFSGSEAAHTSMFKHPHFLMFLIYFGVWAFGVNLCNPFFNLYLLDNLSIDVSWVTLYNGLGAGATLLMLVLWGKLADRIGNRPILLLDGVLVAIIPLLWLGTSTNAVSLWFWFPVLHLLGGGAGAAIDLCINNLQLAIAPVRHHTTYFAITAAIGGVCGAMGAMVGGWLAQSAGSNGITELFVVSSGLRLVALLPLFWLQEPQSRPLGHVWQQLKQQADYWFLGIKPIELPIGCK